VVAAAAGALLVAACGNAGRPTVATGTPGAATATAPAAGASAGASPAATPNGVPAGGPAVGSLPLTTPVPPPTLAGVRYVVPPGWRLATPSPTEVRLTAESGLAVVLTATPGGTPSVTAVNGTAVMVDGSPGLRAAGRSGSGYDVHVTVPRSGTTYDLLCHSGDPGDEQTVNDVCDGFVQALHWLAP
jgi:hypothetical protein